MNDMLSKKEDVSISVFLKSKTNPQKRPSGKLPEVWTFGSPLKIEETADLLTCNVNIDTIHKASIEYYKTQMTKLIQSNKNKPVPKTKEALYSPHRILSDSILGKFSLELEQGFKDIARKSITDAQKVLEKSLKDMFTKICLESDTREKVINDNTRWVPKEDIQNCSSLVTGGINVFTVGHLYVCRAYHEGGWIPGTLFNYPGPNCEALISFDGITHRYKEFEVVLKHD